MFICNKNEICGYDICVHRKLHELDSFEVITAYKNPPKTKEIG